MSKLLRYCKDLLNRTLTRSLLFAFVQLMAGVTVSTQAISPAEAVEPLSVKTANPPYFFDSKGNSVYLSGSYLDQYNALSGSWDFAAYLDSLQKQNQNFTRVWAWEQSPYERTGPGLALDGGLKFDLTRFNQVYFDQLRSRVVQAAQRGIYVSVMLFEGFNAEKKLGGVDPLQQLNNINGINGDPNRNGSNEELFSLTYPSLLAVQEAFLRKVVDTLNDLDNVLYEINGNGLADSLSWQYHMIDYIRRYQKTTANQHPVGISDFYAGATAEVLKSSADWIVIRETNSNPPPPTNKKILIMEGAPSAASGQALSVLPISLFQLVSDSVVSSQSSSITNNVSSNGITLLSSSATSSTLNTTKSSSNQQSQAATPTITPNGGVYSGTVAVTLQTTTPGASIYYTTDGQSPSQSSKRYNGKFTLSQSTLVKAKAFKNNFDPSAEASAWFASAASPVAGSGLVAYWKFDEGSGTSAADASGNGNKGTLVNGPLWTAGRVGNALYFDGINDNVTVPDSNSLDLSNSFTLSAWVNPASTFTDFRSILVKNYSYYLYASVAGYCGDGSPLGGFSGGTNQTVCQPSPLPTNTWTHLAVTYNGSTLTFYRDGLPVTTSTVAGTFSPTSGILQIGGSQFGEYFKGLIDEVRIYNRALNDTEIQTAYKQESATPVQTVGIPVISPSGGNYSNSVPVTMQTATSGASIHYTTDGSTPTQSSNLYAGTVTLTNSATMKAKAFKIGANTSAEASASFTITQPFSFSLSNSGDKAVVAGSSVTNSIAATLVSGSSQSVSFSVSGLPAGTTASLSSAGCSPNCSSTLTINASNSTAAGSSTITVTASGGGTTKTTTFSLNVSPQTVATPTISPNGGSFTNSVSVTLQTATSGASVYYTTDGASPTQSSALYSGPMTLTSSATVKTKAFKNGSNPSAEASASFTVNQSGLVAYWKFDEGSGTTLADASGNGNSGTLVNGPIWSAGRVGKALLFDGINDHVTVADSNSLDLSSAFTLSAWVNPASTFTDFRSILVKNYSYYLYTSVAAYCGNGSPLGGFSGATNQTVCQPSPLPTNTWTHLAVTYNGSTLTFYRDGVAVATSTVSGTLSPTTGTLQIGGSQFGEYFKGLIDEVRIYNKALNDTEIQTAYLQDSPSQTVTPVISQPFSFSLANSGNKSVVAGSSVTNSIAATLVSGSSQTVSFSVSGLPSGATGSFSPASCTPACSTLLNIGTSGSTPAGNFPVTITSAGGGVTRTTAFTISVTPAPTVPTPTSGATYWVAKTGSDSNTCTQARSQSTPKLTINGGLACLASGDTLYIMSGTYYENIGVRRDVDGSCLWAFCFPNGISSSKYTTISAAPGAERQVILGALDGNTVAEFLGPIRYIAFKGIVFDGYKDYVPWYSSSHGVVGGCTYRSSTGESICNDAQGNPTLAEYFLFDNVEVRNNHRQGVLGWANTTFIHSSFHDNGTDRFDHGLYIGGDHNFIMYSQIYRNMGLGFQFHNDTRTVCCNSAIGNIAWDNGDAGYYMEGFNNYFINNVAYSTPGQPNIQHGSGVAAQAKGYQISDAWNSYVLNNTTWGAEACMQVGPRSTNIHIRNNLCVDSLGHIPSGQPGFITLGMWDTGDGTNIMYQTNVTLSGGSNIFADVNARNFQLKSTVSQAIDQGADLSSYGFSNDAAGNARPYGSAWDIGAYEASSGVSISSVTQAP